MLGENIKVFRTKKGYSQETLAQQLNVVRQTVSKWEKGLSVPDAEMLNSLSELFEVPVSTLLGSTVQAEDKEVATETDKRIGEIAQQLAVLNDQLAKRNVQRRKTVKRVIIGVVAALGAFIILWAVCLYFFRIKPKSEAVMTTTWVEGALNGETYAYEFTYDQNFHIYEAGGDAWIADHILIDQYSDFNVAKAQMEDYFVERGGTCTVYEGEYPYWDNEGTDSTEEN